MTRQEQRVAEGAQAIQTQTGNVIINQGVTPEQMLQIMNGVAQQVQLGVEHAAKIVNDRLGEFRQGMIEEFAKPESRGNPDAFNDPDFQYALHEAQKGFARSGEQGLKNELIKLLAQKSAEPGRTRTSLILNEAIQTIASLTHQEISALSFLFLFGHVNVTSPRSKESLVELYRGWIDPFLIDFPKDDFAIEYLGSMRCVVVNQISSTNLWSIIEERYSNVFTKGFTLATIREAIGGKEVPNGITEPIKDHFAGLLRFKPANKDELAKIAKSESLNDLDITGLNDLWSRTNASKEEIVDFFTKSLPQMAELADIWNSTSVKSSSLTGLGKAIAHSALTSRADFNAPLDIWVK